MEVGVHAAIETNLGFYYQGLYSILVLLNSKSDESNIILETYDDIYLDDGDKKNLYQIKHRSKNIKKLSIKSDDLWKTLLIWSKTENKEKSKFILVTCDYIEKGCILEEFTKSVRNIEELKKQLFEEANRVICERQEYENDICLGKQKVQKYPPHEKKIKGCQAFIKMKTNDIDKILNNIYIMHSSFKIYDFEGQLETKFSDLILKETRKKLVEKLVEWWSYRTVKSMMNEELKMISKSEVQRKIWDLVYSINEERFPIINVNAKPSKEEIEQHKEKSSIMIKQIELVNGGEVRTHKALINNWKARKLRDEWIDEDISYANELDEYDMSLIDTWSYNFELLKEKDLSEDEKIRDGLELYEWSLKEAKDEIDVNNEKLKTNFLVHGTYQILSNDLKVGWHVDYQEKLKGDVSSGEC
ncbi:ABC-three component system protein [Clostridium beijerinckii]|uniref:ABC-three component system protein n=1 Tax=Clostridium beijerinckii TaxID=1520 RepID=UPI0014942610|nr:ABC-three component system protein [Clostridium beijerinckii]NOW07777.1 hypothetical protein [Clostridium beijerinckii]NYC04449.1 hypothetical protein [Clostridium beijerinckii]